jgi:outer membrane protein assembly factor BamB
MRKIAIWLTATVAAGVLTALGVRAQMDGWRQWGGPDRNFVVPSPAALADRWPASGPPVAWRRALGDGHSAILADNGRLFTVYRPIVPGVGQFADREVVVALDEATGTTLWEHSYPARPLNFRFGAGPYGTPLIVGARLFNVGTNNQFMALDTATGKVLWSHNLVADFGANETLVRPAVKAGISISPVAYRNMVITVAGGEGQTVMAFDQATGKVAWKSGTFNIGQASPLIVTHGGRPQLIVFGGTGVFALDPADGRALWSHPHETDGDMNISMPLWHPDGLLFLTSAYNGGSRLLRLGSGEPAGRVEERWFTNRLRVQIGNAMWMGDYILGSSGDFGPTPMTAADVATGEVLWQDRSFARASFLRVGDRLLLLDEDGDLGLVRPSRSGLEVLARASILTNRAWTVPSLVGRSLYARDRRNIMKLTLP